MVVAQIVLLFAAGIALLLYSIFSLSKVMQEVVSRNIRVYFGKATSKPIYGAGTGILLTLLFKSSTAVELLTISLVSAGLLTFFNSLGIILGANVGTSLTMQLVAFRITVIAPLIMLAGFLIFILGKNKKTLGKALFYFGMLFFGFELIGKASAILRENPTFINMLVQFENPLLAILAATAVTAVIQSSSAVTGMIIMLGTQGLISLEAAIPLVLGANIGTTVTGLIVTIGGSISARRTALAHAFFNIFGVLLILPFLAPFTSLIRMTSSSLPHQIANAHLIYNLIIASIFLMAITPFASFIMKILPGKELALSLWPKYIDEYLLVQPQQALKAVKKETSRALAITNVMFSKAASTLFTYKQTLAVEINHCEQVIDSINLELHSYLGKIATITRENLAPYLNLINDIERIGDRSVNLVEIAELKRKHGIEFSRNTEEAICILIEAISSTVKDIKKLNVHYDEGLFKKICERNVHITKLIEQLKAKEERGLISLVYSELIENLERILEHCGSAARNVQLANKLK